MTIGALLMKMDFQLQVVEARDMLRLDYIPCVLTIVSTVLVGRRMWYGWIVAGVNSLLICVIGARTDQFGFFPANVFCIALYSYNLWAWRRCPQQISEGPDCALSKGN